MVEQQADILAPLSPLHSKTESVMQASSQGVSITEVPFLTQINLRGDSNNKAFLAGVKKALGVALPTQPNRVAEKGDIAVLWLGPDEWLVVSNESDPHRPISTLRVMMSDVFFSAVDVSDNRTVVNLRGPKTWAVLNKGSVLDFHPRSWQKNKCASSLYGKCQVIFWQRSEEPDFYLLVRSSFSDYCASYLIDAMKEFED